MQPEHPASARALQESIAPSPLARDGLGFFCFCAMPLQSRLKAKNSSFLFDEVADLLIFGGFIGAFAVVLVLFLFGLSLVFKTVTAAGDRDGLGVVQEAVEDGASPSSSVGEAKAVFFRVA